jgi:diamine N-acetyltransferase
MTKPSIKLQRVTEDNHLQVVGITTNENQTDFYPSIESSLELAAKYENAHPFAILLGEEVCGFLMYGIDETTKLWKIYRLVIDKRYQRQGIGRVVMELALSELKNHHGANEVLIVYNEENTSAINLYRSLGFVQFGNEGKRILAKTILSQ